MQDEAQNKQSDFSAFEGTRPVQEQQRFDSDALGAWLAAHIDGFRGPLTVEQFAGGQSNPTFKLVTPTHSYVMRAKPGPAAKLLPSAHAIEREYRVMHALASTDVPVARMLALCEDESVIGRAFYVMEFVQGRVLWDQSLPGMTPAQRGAIYDEMNRVIAALHTVGVAQRMHHAILAFDCMRGRQQFRGRPGLRAHHIGTRRRDQLERGIRLAACELFERQWPGKSVDMLREPRRQRIDVDALPFADGTRAFEG